MLSEAFFRMKGWASVLRDSFNRNFRHFREHRIEYISTSELTPEQRAAFDAGFEAMDEAFGHMNRAFGKMDKAFNAVFPKGSGPDNSLHGRDTDG